MGGIVAGDNVTLAHSGATFDDWNAGTGVDHYIVEEESGSGFAEVANLPDTMLYQDLEKHVENMLDEYTAKHGV